MFKFLKSMKWFIIPNWYRYVLVLIFGLSLAFLNLLPAMIIANLTKGLEEGNLTTHILIYEIFLPFVGTVLLIYATAVTKRIFQNRLTTTLYHALHKRYMDSILKQDATFFEKYQAGDLLVRALGDINTVKFSGGNRLLNIFMESMTVVFTFIAMLFISPLLAIYCILPLSLILVTNLVLKPIVKKNFKMVREAHSLMGNKVLESITNVRTIRAFSKEDEDYISNIEYSENAYVIEKKNLKINVIFQPLFLLFAAIATIICYGLGAYYYSIGYITLSELVKFIMYLNLFQAPLNNIGNLINNFYQSLISADRLNEVYDSKSKIKEDELELDRIDSIEFKNFSFNYEGDNFDSLKNINLTIPSGITLGIVGHTGSGKSTLVKQLLRQLPTSDESIFINGKPIECYKKESIRRYVSYVPQEHVLFSRSVYDNVKIGLTDATKEDVEKAIELADFKKDIENLADGLDTIVGEYGVTLSGGQKQRLGIARALLKNSDVLIFDDSLSAVDGKTEANIIEALNKFRKNKTNIIVAHRLSAVMGADLIIVLDEGRIIEYGNHKDLMNLKCWYYNQFIAQQMEDKNE